MRFHRERRGVGEVFGVLLTLAMVVSLGVLIFGFSSGGMSSLSESYAAAMSNRMNGISEKFAIEQVTFTIPTLSLDGSASATAATAIAFDAASSSPSGLGAVSSFSWSHTVGSGLSNSILIVGVSVEKSSGFDASAVTYNGVSMTKTVGAGGSGQLKASIWYLLNPASGTNTIAVTLSGTVGTDGVAGGAVSLSGVDQTNPLPTTNAGAAATSAPTLSITTVNAHSWVLGVLSWDSAVTDPTPSGTTPVTTRWDVAATGMRGEGSTTRTTTAGSVTTSWTGSDNWAIANAEIKAAPSNLALDGSCTASSTTTSVSCSLTTAHTNDVIYVALSTTSSSSSSLAVSGASLTWTQRGSKVSTGSVPASLAAFYAIASSTLSSASITASASTSGIVIQAFGISGANTATPFDSHTGIPASATGSGTPATVSISTSNANDFIIGADVDNSGSAGTAGTGYTLIKSKTGPTSLTEYEIVSATQTNLAVTANPAAGSSAKWIMWADAVQAGVVSVSLTTTNANDVIYAVVQTDSGTITAPTATGLTFILRKSLPANGAGGVLSTYYAIASSALSALSITAHATGNIDINLIVFGISGAGTGSPFDSNAAVPASATGTGTAATVSISTSNANDFIIGAVGSNAQTADTAGTGFTLIQTIFQADQNIRASSEYYIVSTTQTNLAVPFTLGSGASAWEMIADAIQAPTPGADVYVRNVGERPLTIVAVYISDLTSNTFVSQTTLSTALNVGTFVDVPNTTLTFTPSHGHTYSFTVTSSLGSSKIYSLKVT